MLPLEPSIELVCGSRLGGHPGPASGGRPASGGGLPGEHREKRGDAITHLASIHDQVDRTVREACRLTGKQARLATAGGHVELDKSIVEALTEPLVHLVRNAVDHGIEDPSTRTRAGKDPVGTVRVSARTEGGRTLLELSDDGGGLRFITT